MSNHTSGTAGAGYRVPSQPHRYRAPAPDWGLLPNCTDCGQPRDDHEEKRA